MQRSSNRWLARKQMNDLEILVDQALDEIESALAEAEERRQFGREFSISRLSLGLRTVRSILKGEE